VTPEIFIFWFLAVTTVASAVLVVAMANPVFSALALAMTMIGVSAIFVTLNAYFLAGVQLIVYAGAVTVLFVMVLMLFDLKSELKAFTRGKISGTIKVGTVAMFSGIVISAIMITARDLLKGPPAPLTTYGGDTTKDIGKLLFSKYVFSFEALGVLLLIVAVGAVALSRSKGGTHHVER